MKVHFSLYSSEIYNQPELVISLNRLTYAYNNQKVGCDHVYQHRQLYSYDGEGSQNRNRLLFMAVFQISQTRQLRLMEKRL